MAFRIQDLMMDVRPGGLRMANPECTCQVSARPEIQQEPEVPAEEPDSPCIESTWQDTLPLSGGLPEQVDALAAGLAQLRAQLRRDLGQGG